MTDLLIVIAVAAVAAAVGIWLGIVLIAPRLGRALDRADEARGAATTEDANGESPPEAIDADVCARATPRTCTGSSSDACCSPSS